MVWGGSFDVSFSERNWWSTIDNRTDLFFFRVRFDLKKGKNFMNNPATQAVRVEVYSTALCPYCSRARHLLEKKGIEFTEYRVDKDPQLRTEMEQRSQRTSVPQIFISDRHIGGFDDMVELDMDGELDTLLGLEKS
jgi:glutaredoxin 3